jgi:hypothetical protein
MNRRPGNSFLRIIGAAGGDDPFHFGIELIRRSSSRGGTTSSAGLAGPGSVKESPSPQVVTHLTPDFLQAGALGGKPIGLGRRRPAAARAPLVR